MSAGPRVAAPVPAGRSARTRARVAALAITMVGGVLPSAAAGQSPVVDAYVAEGVQAAFSQRQQAIEVARAGAQRREALANALPRVDVSSIRTEVGGNVVDIGRFINPAYATLNQLIGQERFPTDLTFRLPFRQQSFVRVTQPVFAPAAWYGAAAAGHAEDAQRAGRDAATRQLAADVRLAWLDWYRARQAVAVLDAAIPLVEEQLRVSERLVQAGVRTPDAPLRARAELSAVRQQRAEAGQQAEAAGRYLNHLVARPLDRPVDAGPDLDVPPMPQVDSVLARARIGREELRQLEAAGSAAGALQRSAQSAFLPTVAVALDYGIQGQDYQWNGEREFRVATVIAQWPVFSGAADRARVQQAALQRRSVATRRDEVVSLVELQVRTAHRAAQVAREAIATAEDQEAAAARAFELVRRRHDEGLAPPIELLDARRALTAASLNRVLTIADYHARRVELDRAAALDTGITP